MCGVFRQLLWHSASKENFACASKAILGTVYPTSYSLGFSASLVTDAMGIQLLLDPGISRKYQVCPASDHPHCLHSLVYWAEGGPSLGDYPRRCPWEKWPQHWRTYEGKRNPSTGHRMYIGKTRNILDSAGKKLESDFYLWVCFK